MTKELTRKQLKEMGIYSIDWDRQNEEWWVDRYWIVSGSVKEKVHKKLKITEVVCKHKYSGEKRYPAVGFSYESKPVVIPLGRLIYCWFLDDIPAGMDVDHIDNNPFNNRLENLQLLTREENLAKRYSDNEDTCCNQYTYCKEHGLTPDKKKPSRKKKCKQ